MIVRFSKYDFWNPGEISHRHRKKSIKKYFSSRSKIFVEKVEKIFFETKKLSIFFSMKKPMKIENFEILIFGGNFPKFLNFQFSFGYGRSYISRIYRCWTLPNQIEIFIWLGKVQHRLNVLMILLF